MERRTRDEVNDMTEITEEFASQFLNRRIIVNRCNGSKREVEIMFDRNTEKYAYVNLTTHHICRCRFNTIQDAVDDLYQDDFVKSFKFKDGSFEYDKKAK